MIFTMSTYKKKFFKKVSKSEDGTKSNPSKHELKFAPLDPKGFAKQATYQQVKDALLIAIDAAIDDDLLDIRSCIENEVLQQPALPVKVRPTGSNAEEIKESKETNKILHDIQLKKYDHRVDNLGKNQVKVQSIIYNQFTAKSMKEKLERLSNFHTMLAKNPVELLKEIKVQMHNTVRAQHLEWTRITATLKNFCLFAKGTCLLPIILFTLRNYAMSSLRRMERDSTILTLLQRLTDSAS